MRKGLPPRVPNVHCGNNKGNHGNQAKVEGSLWAAATGHRSRSPLRKAADGAKICNKVRSRCGGHARRKPTWHLATKHRPVLSDTASGARMVNAKQVPRTTSLALLADLPNGRATQVG